MPRHKWVMRRVVENNIPYVYKYGSLKGQVCQTRRKRRLECGHLIWEHNPISTADALRCVFQAIDAKKGKPIKARCYECGKNADR